MPKYMVCIPEVHVSLREVEADTPEEAKKIAGDNFDTEVLLEYSHSLNLDMWTVEEQEDA